MRFKINDMKLVRKMTRAVIFMYMRTRISVEQHNFKQHCCLPYILKNNPDTILNFIIVEHHDMSKLLERGGGGGSEDHCPLPAKAHKEKKIYICYGIY